MKINIIHYHITNNLPSCQELKKDLYEKISRVFRGVLSKLEAFNEYIHTQNAVTGAREIRLIPTSFENGLGSVLYPLHLLNSGGMIKEDNPNPEYRRLVEMVHTIGKELTAHCPRKNLKTKFTLVNSAIPNAWCLPGGKIAINLGLIQKMEKDQNEYGGYKPTIQEKISAVLAHELEHAAASHGTLAMQFHFLLWVVLTLVQYILLRLRGISIPVTNIFDLTSLHGSRQQELEADKGSMYLLKEVAKTEDNAADLSSDSPRAAIWLQYYFKSIGHSETGFDLLNHIMNLYSTHPTEDERIEANRATWEKIGNKELDPSDPYARAYLGQ